MTDRSGQSKVMGSRELISETIPQDRDGSASAYYMGAKSVTGYALLVWLFLDIGGIWVLWIYRCCTPVFTENRQDIGNNNPLTI